LPRTQSRWFARQPWWQTWRQHLSVTQKDGQLVIQRRWEPHAFNLALYAVIVGGLPWLSYAIPALQNFLLHQSSGLLLFLRVFYGLLFAVPAVQARRFILRRRTFVFDCTHDFVTADDRVVCALSEVQSVRVGKPLNAEGERKGLEVLIHGRNEVPIDWNDLLGANMDELGQAGLALSQYAQIPLWTEGAWHNPAEPHIAAPAAAPDPSRLIQGRE
jgi:hypothetical protein